MRKFKSLTKDECIKIASLLAPNINWEFHQSDNEWDGFDLVCGFDGAVFEKIFQIDYSKDVEFENRFRYYENLWEHKINVEPIKEYLTAIGVEI